MILSPKDTGLNYRSLFHFIPGNHLILLADAPHFTIVDVSDDYTYNTLSKREEILGKGLFEAFITTPGDPETSGVSNLTESFNQVILTKEEHCTELQHYAAFDSRTRTSEFKMWRSVNKPLLNEEGNVEYILHSAEDVTSNKIAEEKAEETQSLFKRLVKQVPMGIVVVSGSGFTVDIANEFYCRIANRTEEQLVGNPIFDVIPEARDFYTPLISKVMQTGERLQLYNSPYVAVENGIEKHGFLNIVYQPYKDAGGNISGIIILLYEVTEQVNALRKREMAEARSQLAIQLAELGMYDVNLKTDDLDTNERYKEIMGFAQGNTRSDYRQLLHPEDAIVIEKAYASAFLTGILNYEARIIKPDETIGWIRATGKIFFDAHGEADKLLGVIQDITTQKEFANELEQMVEKRMKELVEVNLQLQQSNMELNQFAYITSHDMQEPLRKIKTFTQLLESALENIPDKAQVYMDKIKSSADRMQSLIRDVLQFSELSKEGEKFLATDLNEVLKNVLNDYELLIEEKGAKVQMNHMPVIEGIPVQMNLLFSNLISNALKFGINDRPLEINIICIKLTESMVDEYQILDVNKKYYRINISDNGIGFGQQYAEKIFDIFQRLHAKTEYAGTGIGLALCRKIILNHHGLISATSIHKEGALFSIVLPEKQEHLE